MSKRIAFFHAPAVERRSARSGLTLSLHRNSDEIGKRILQIFALLPEEGADKIPSLLLAPIKGAGTRKEDLRA
jgi:hypothetical protein